MKTIVFLTLCAILLTPFPARAEDSQHLLITQVQITGGTGFTNNDFIEIYNPTNGDVDLIGHYLVKRTKTGTSDFIIVFWTQPTIIPAGKFYLLSHADYTTISSTPDKVFTESLSNDNGIALKSPANEVVDSVGWGEAANAFVEGVVFATNPTADNSISRKFSESNIPQDTNDNSQDFKVTAASPRNLNFIWPEPEPDPEPIPEPEEEEQVIYSNAVRISEFMVNPLGSDAGNEWVEVYASADADISGWILDDEGSVGIAGTSALVIPNNTHISAGAYLVFQIPSGKAAFNNTGGDTVRLMHPNFNLADSVTYTQSAPEAQSYAKNELGVFAWTSIVTKGSANQFPQVVEEEDEDEEEVELEEQEEIDFVRINEIFPNPEGSDSGNEFIELINVGNISVALNNWILDDGEEDSSIGSTSFKLENVSISSGQVLLIQIPKSKFTLNNTGEESVRLFDQNKNLVDLVSYTDAKEGESYSLVEDEWFWTTPTPGVENEIAEEVVYTDEIVIYSLLPEPHLGEDEYIELLNQSSEDVSLQDWVIADEAREYKIKDVIIPAGGVIKILKSQSKISLNNFGEETVTLYNPLGEIVSQVQYEDPERGEVIAFSDSTGGGLVRTGSLFKPNPLVIVFSILFWYIYIVFSHKNKEI